MQDDFCDLTRLIRSLQRLEGKLECFGSGQLSCEGAAFAGRAHYLKPEADTASICERLFDQITDQKQINMGLLLEKRATKRHLIKTSSACR
jgi:hypothetical protein